MGHANAMTDLSPDFADAARAATVALRDLFPATPLQRNAFLSERYGADIWLKREDLSPVRSYKIRGAFNAMRKRMAGGDGASGFVCASAGNHAQGVALAAKSHGVPAVIVMPSDCPQLKINNTRAYGAEVVLYDRVKESREEIGKALSEERGLPLIRPYDEPQVIAGQGTCGLEIAEDANRMGIKDADVIVCCGGGGLTSGIALALEADAPTLRVRPAEPEGFDDVARSLRSGGIERNNQLAGSICDAIISPQPGDITWPILQRLVGPGLVISDDEALQAMAHAFNRLKVVAEPGGAAALAAALVRGDEIEGEDVILTISGGNVDPDMFARALETLA